MTQMHYLLRKVQMGGSWFFGC